MSFLVVLPLVQGLLTAPAVAGEASPVAITVRRELGGEVFASTKPLPIILNTNQTGRTFQDRSYVFRVSRPAGRPASSSSTAAAALERPSIAQASLDRPSAGHHTAVDVFQAATSFPASPVGAAYPVVVTLKGVDGAVLGKPVQLSLVGAVASSGDDAAPIVVPLGVAPGTKDLITAVFALDLVDQGSGRAKLVARVSDDADGSVGSVEVRFLDTSAGPAPKATTVTLPWRSGKVRFELAEEAAHQLADTAPFPGGTFDADWSLLTVKGDTVDGGVAVVSAEIDDVVLRQISFSLGGRKEPTFDARVRVAATDPWALAGDLDLELESLDAVDPDGLPLRIDASLPLASVDVVRDLPVALTGDPKGFVYLLSVQGVDGSGKPVGVADECKLVLVVGDGCTTSAGAEVEVVSVKGTDVRLRHRAASTQDTAWLTPALVTYTLQSPEGGAATVDKIHTSTDRFAVGATGRVILPGNAFDTGGVWQVTLRLRDGAGVPVIGFVTAMEAECCGEVLIDHYKHCDDGVQDPGENCIGVE